MTRNNDDKPADEQSGETHNKRKNISVRPTPEQLNELHERAASFGYKSVSQYLIERGLRESGLMIRSVDRERVERLLFEARKIGVNINQIARGMSAGYKGYSQKHLDGALREAERVMREICQEFTLGEGEQE